jgi:hypothetical protein
MQPQRMSGVASCAARSAIVLAAVLLSIGLSACGGGSDDALARVDGSPIADAAVDHWLSVIDGTTTAKAQQLSQRRSVLSFLIFSRWVLREAAADGVRVTDDEAQARLELLGNGQNEAPAGTGLLGERLLPKLLAMARSRADRLWLLKLAVLTARLEARTLSKFERQLTSAQIAGYYRAHPSLYVLPERRDVEWIVTYSYAWLAKAVAEIRAGKNFISVATRVSKDVPTIVGMERHPRAEKQLAKHVFAAKLHVLTGPFKQSANRYEFEVTRVIPARRRTLAESEGSIRRRLALAPALAAFASTIERKWAARTSCAGDLVRGCASDLGAASQGASIGSHKHRSV